MNLSDLGRSLRRSWRVVVASSCLLGLGVSTGYAADWTQFRGLDNTGVAEGESPPLAWGITSASDTAMRNIAWKAPLPGRGVSGPIVVDGKVFVTSAEGALQDDLVREEQLFVLCFDAASGKPLWKRRFWTTGRSLCHPTSSVAAPTPASDGKYVFAFFSSNDLACLDLNGNLKWFRGLTHDYPTAANDVGMASSPVVIGDTVIVQVESKGDAFAAGIDVATGEERWRIPREPTMNWCSPSVLRGSQGEPDLALIQSPSRISAHDPRTGEQVWSYDQGCSQIPSAAARNGVIYVPSAGLTALDASGKNAAPPRVWQEGKLGPTNASPVVTNTEVYTLQNSVLNCAEIGDGKTRWQLRLKGNFWATPILVGEHLFLINDQGLGQVVKLGEKGKLLGECDLAEPVLGSPAVADGALYVRGSGNLWKIAATEGKP